MTTPPRRIARRRPRRAAAATATLITAGLFAAAPALAVAGHAGTASAREHASLDAVSCQRSWCMAVGSLVDTGRRTHSLAQVWNGKAWLTMTGPEDAVTDPSCGTRTLCMVVAAGNSNSGAVAESWNGRRWHTWFQNTSVCGGPPGQCGLSGIACGNGANCVGVGTETLDNEGDQVDAGAFWNGKAWQLTAAPGNGDPAADNAVACAGTFCMAVGFRTIKGVKQTLAELWNGSRWRIIATPVFR